MKDSTKMKVLACLALLVCAAVAERTTRHAVKELSVSNAHDWGSWGEPQFCPQGTFASGFRLKVESPQGRADDSGLNAIELQCSHMVASGDYGTATSKQGAWGEWTGWKSCMKASNRQLFLTSFRLLVEPYQGSKAWNDDTGADDVDFHCRQLDGSGEYRLEGESPAPWGEPGEWSDSCDQGTAICGLKTKVEVPQGRGDDTALNDVKFYCCHFR